MDFTTTVITTLIAAAAFAGILAGYLISSKFEYSSTTVNVMAMGMGLLLGPIAMGIAIALFVFVPIVLFGIAAAIFVVIKIARSRKTAKEVAEADVVAHRSSPQKGAYKDSHGRNF